MPATLPRLLDYLVENEPELLNEMRNICRGFGGSLAHLTEWRVDMSAKSTTNAGLCRFETIHNYDPETDKDGWKYIKQGGTINVNRALTPEQASQVLRHEIAHAIAEGFAPGVGHGLAWLECADALGYEGGQYATAEECETIRQGNLSTGAEKPVARCSAGCGFVITRARYGTKDWGRFGHECPNGEVSRLENIGRQGPKQ